MYEKQRATYWVARKKTPQNVSNCYNLTITANGMAVQKGNDIRSEQAIEMNFLGDVGKSFLQSFLNVLLNTKCALLTEFVQLLKHVCAVKNWGLLKWERVERGEGREKRGEEKCAVLKIAFKRSKRPQTSCLPS